jgi:hypothetical protein
MLHRDPISKNKPIIIIIIIIIIIMALEHLDIHMQKNEDGL